MHRREFVTAAGAAAAVVSAAQAFANPASVAAESMHPAKLRLSKNQPLIVSRPAKPACGIVSACSL
jgi:hypothetical protein